FFAIHTTINEYQYRQVFKAVRIDFSMENEIRIVRMKSGSFKCLGCGREYSNEIEALFCGCGFD
ncbi:MAG: hypothetical protein QXO03_02480, partial [Thermoplasmatales archaeon]